MLEPTSANIRAEMARRQVKAIDVARRMGIHRNYLYMLLRDERPMKGNLPYRIGAAINGLLKEIVFKVPPELGPRSV